MSRNNPWVVRDRRYRSGARWTLHGKRMLFLCLFVPFMLLISFATSTTFGVWVLLIMLTPVAIRLVRRYRRPVAPPPDYPEIDGDEPLGERNTRSIPQDVKVAVAARDQGRCRQCGSTEELHYDHVIPWSKGGANTINNIQLLCGPCNRHKSASMN
jgi:hypothetical protein